MFTRQSILLVLLAVAAAPAVVAIPKLSDSVKLISGDSANQQSLSATPPNPQDLSADWWRYFDVDSATLNQRIVKFSERLTVWAKDETLNRKVNIAQLIENLQRYRELRDKPTPETAVSMELLNAYTLRQWLDLEHKRQTMQAQLQSEREDGRQDEKRHAVERRSLDTMMAAYLDVADRTEEKFVQGVRIIAEWAQLALDSERLRLKKALLAVNEAQLTHLLKEIKIARQRIAVSEKDLELLQNGIKQAENELVNARENLTELLSVIEVTNLETEVGQARILLSKQRITHASIQEALAEAVLSRKRIESVLTQVLLAPDAGQLDLFKSELRDQSDNIASLRDRLENWREKAETDQGRAGKSLADLFVAADTQSSELVSLTQQRLAVVQNTLLSLQRLDSEIHDAELIADWVKTLVANKEGALISSWSNVKSSTVRILELVWERLQASLFKIGDTPVTALGLLRVLLIVTLAWILSYFVRRGLTHLSERQGGSLTYLYALGRLMHYLILVIGISIGLSSIGVDLSNFALIAGALSLGVGFGLQAVVNNFVSGLIVLFERSVRIGDFVELANGLAGEVKAINVRSTLVTTTDMVDILVPNSEFVNGQVINWTLTDASRRIHIPFGVAYGSDKDAVKKAALEAAYNTPHTLKNLSTREPEVWLTNFGNSSLDFELIVWVLPHAVKRPQRVRAAYYWELETALKKYGIEIPFPQRDLHIRSGLSVPQDELKKTIQPDFAAGGESNRT
ncbi:mechanosensitive ion channel domain-containing protein [Methylomonas sp. MgM2]